MPRIQLLRKGGTVIELNAENIIMNMDRIVTAFPIPIVATRVALDLNQSIFEIMVEGVLIDDEEASGGAGASFSMDLSMTGSSIPSTTWYSSYSSWNTVKTDLYGVEIVFKTIGQINAGLGEDITVKLYDGSGGTSSNVVATNSIIYVRADNTTNTQTLASAIATAVAGASAKVNTVTTALSTILSVTQSAGQSTANSYYAQTSTTGTYAGELIKIVNSTLGVAGDSAVVVQKGATGQQWSTPFFVTNMNGGAESSKMTKGDKVQDLLNLANMSAGGALVSPNVLTGAALDLPEGVASFDASKFLRLEEAKAVKKYIVGIRIPYESLASSSTGGTVLRQFLLPAGPGTDHSPESNTRSFDPSIVVNNETTRPNPFLEQGVAIPGILTKFSPKYEAGDSIWTYDLTILATEQLVGI